MCMVCFIFFKQKTAYGMRISDWSSDVCSSDLAPSGRPFFLPATGSADRFGPAQGLERDRVGEGDPVEDRRGVVADLQHQAAHPTIDLGQAILAMLVRVAACAGHERERAAGQADEIAIADVDRRQRKMIAAVASPLRAAQPPARHFRQEYGPEFGGKER